MVIGVPWDLRHLLPVNLLFVSRTDLSGLARIYVVFDCPQRSGAEELMRNALESFPQLPIEFLFHPPVTGNVIQWVNVSTYYNSMNCATAISRCQTKYILLHDFDLYPLVPNYFTSVIDKMKTEDLKFCGLEHTTFDGLSEKDGLIGTWCLGIDAAWLRANYRPIDCFQRIVNMNGRLVQLDPFSYLQTKTPKRSLVQTLDGQACCHVKNLCGTYVRYKTGRRPDFVWRLHYLWYLESLSGHDQRLAEVIDVMRNADSGVLRLGNFQTDFSRTHVTCGNVLREELGRMENVLFGKIRPQVRDFLDSFEQFLLRSGDSTPLDRYVKSPN